MLQMTEKEMKKLNSIKKILGGECTKKEAVESLGITTRQIDRLILKYQNEGEKCKRIDFFNKVLNVCEKGHYEGPITLVPANQLAEYCT